MRALIFAAALMLIAPAARAQTSPAPAPEGAVTVAADQNGQSVEAKVGGQIAIELQRSGSIGTNWALASKPDFLGDPTQLSGPTVASSRPMLGAPSWQVFVFAVRDAGAGEVTIEKHDRTGAAIETFTVAVNAAAQ